MGLAQQTNNDQLVAQPAKGAMITLGSESFWIGGNEDPQQNADYRFSA
jgi:hypothetical protein